jgi:hypothetical protein
MRSQKQQHASRTNGAKSKGPKTPEGKNISKFNGVKHGLRAEQVVLPGEDPAEFEAELQGWIDDWKPRSHTRAVLVERAAVASWRLRRAVRVESARLRQLAQDAADRFDSERIARVDSAVSQVETDPKGALIRLEMHAAGIDRLVTAWTELETALAVGPAGWNQASYHTRIMALLGHYASDDPAGAGPLPLASARLLVTNVPDSKAHPHPLPPDRREAVADDLRRLCSEHLARLRARRAEVGDPDVLRRQAADAAIDTTSLETHLRHRYEMAHDNSLRATVNQLMALEKSGADLAEVETYPISGEKDTSSDGPSEPAAEVVSPGSVGAIGVGFVATHDDGPMGASRASIRTAEPSGGGGLGR